MEGAQELFPQPVMTFHRLSHVIFFIPPPQNRSKKRKASKTFSTLFGTSKPNETACSIQTCAFLPNKFSKHRERKAEISEMQISKVLEFWWFYMFFAWKHHRKNRPKLLEKGRNAHFQILKHSVWPQTCRKKTHRKDRPSKLSQSTSNLRFATVGCFGKKWTKTTSNQMVVNSMVQFAKKTACIKKNKKMFDYTALKQVATIWQMGVVYLANILARGRVVWGGVGF